MNKVILMGRLTRDSEVRYSQGESQTAIARFTLAVDRRFKQEEENKTADFISCVAFGRTAEFMERYGRQGVKFVAEGRIQTGSYTNKEGKKVYTTDVVVENIEFAESKSSQGGTQGNEKGSSADPYTSPMGDGFMNIPNGVEDEGLPFN